MTSTIPLRETGLSPDGHSPSRRRRAWAATISVTLAAALVAGATVAIRAGAEAAPRPPAAPPPAVRTLVPERADGHDVRRAYAARVEPARESRLSFEAGGTLVEVTVDEGDRVPAGTVLARLDTRLLLARRDRLAAVRTALDSDVELASLALARQTKLEDRGFAANQALDEARLAATRLTSRIAEADAALALVDIELDKAVLRAPFDALVGDRHLDPGATVSSGTPVLGLLGAGAPRLRAGLPPERAARLDRDRSYRFVAGEREIPARLVTLRGDVDPRTRTVSAVFEPVDVPGPDDGDPLFFGELLELVLVERVPGVVFDIPLAALAEDERGLWSVLSVIESADASDASADRREDDAGDAGTSGSGSARLRRVAVDIVSLTGNRAWVAAAGLDDATRIVADGSHRVVHGERVRIAAPGSPGTDDTPVPVDGARNGRVAAGKRGA